MSTRRVRFLPYILLRTLFLILPSYAYGLPLDTNQLGTSKNPTLRYYSDSPVFWQEWSEETLQKAHSGNKLLFISIGFASCHWCHVMEQETFSDPQLASYLNENFICIRVDKDERPEIDRIYQEYATFTEQNTGWPMNVIAASNGTPVDTQTYVSAEELLEKLKNFHELYQNNTDFISYVEAVKGIINSMQRPISDQHFGYSTLDTLKSSLDWQEGGALSSFKFPLSPLLNYTLSSNDTTLNQHAFLSINKILSGGIYDHVVGGIHRYTTDTLWRFPHWEKTLSDNAQFISNLCRAYHLSHNELYLARAVETAQFILDNLTLDNGLYANSLDSESSGEEGSFYLWTYSELQNLLGSNFEDFCRVFEITESGNFSLNKNVLYLSKSVNPIYYDPNPIIQKCLQLLRNERQKRIAPRQDEKATICYNAMFMQACIDLYTASKNDDYLYHAYAIMENIESVSNSMTSALPHCIVDLTVLSEGVLEDYASYIKSLISLYQIHGSEALLIRAKEYADYTCTHFIYENSIWFQYTKNDLEQTFKLIEKSDDDSPSPNALMAENLYTLGRYFDDETWMNRSINLSIYMAEQVYNYPIEHASWYYLQSIFSEPEINLVFSGERARGLVLEFKKKYRTFSTISYAIPETLIPLAKNKYSEKENLIYVCMNRTCQRPVKTVEEALSMIESLQSK